MSEKIAVIVPVYNVQEYLNRCVESIINQTYENLEIILIDDGSTDNSGDICDYYKQLDGRIVVIHQENKGLSAARNAGLDIHTSDYIGFVDSDDWIEKDMFFLLHGNLKKYNADISICNVNLINCNGDLVDYKGDPIGENNHEEIEVKLYNDFLDALNDNEHNVKECVWNKLYKSKLWNNIRFPFKKVFEDIFTLYFIIEKAKIICSDNSFKYNYQTRNTSISKNFSMQNFDIIDGLINRYQYLSNKYPVLENKYRRTIFNGFLYILKNAYDNGKFKTYDSQINEMTNKVKSYPTMNCGMSDEDVRFFDLLLKNYKSYSVVSKIQKKPIIIDRLPP